MPKDVSCEQQRSTLEIPGSGLGVPTLSLEPRGFSARIATLEHKAITAKVLASNGYRFALLLGGCRSWHLLKDTIPCLLPDCYIL